MKRHQLSKLAHEACLYVILQLSDVTCEIGVWDLMIEVSSKHLMATRQAGPRWTLQVCLPIVAL